MRLNSVLHNAEDQQFSRRIGVNRPNRFLASADATFANRVATSSNWPLSSPSSGLGAPPSRPPSGRSSCGRCGGTVLAALEAPPPPLRPPSRGGGTVDAAESPPPALGFPTSLRNKCAAQDRTL